jgi:hypothetical protein
MKPIRHRSRWSTTATFGGRVPVEPVGDRVRDSREHGLVTVLTGCTRTALFHLLEKWVLPNRVQLGDVFY